MKMKKVIGMLVVILILLATIFTAYPNITYAADASYVLGITNIRENKEAYGIGGLKSDNTPVKKVWKIVSYTGAGNTINYNNAFYCIKAEHGFVSNNGTDVSAIRKTYDTKFDMKSQKDEVITKLNAINTAIGDTPLSQETYNKLIWIFDNMYLPKASSAKNDKEALLNEVAKEENSVLTNENSLLTDEDIEVAQQLAVWHFTNPNDTNYNPNTLTTIYSNNKTGKDSNYKSLADWGDDPVANVQDGRVRQLQMDQLYNYFITNANKHSNYLSEVASKTNAPVTFDKTNAKAEQVGEKYIVGPFKINVEANRKYNISELGFKDQSGKTINLNGENQLLDKNKQVVSSGKIEDVFNQNFYITLPITTLVENINFSLKGTYPKTRRNFLYNIRKYI